MSPAGSSVGLLGGTFDPIHNGHLAIAAAVRDALDLAGIVFIPAGIPPHKPGQQVSPGEDRRAMVALAIAGRPDFGLSTIELDRPGPSYAVDTLAQLADSDGPAGPDGSPGRSLEFVLSAEAFAGFPGWREASYYTRFLRRFDAPLIHILKPRLHHRETFFNPAFVRNRTGVRMRGRGANVLFRDSRRGADGGANRIGPFVR